MCASRRRSGGLTLVELVIFLVLVGIALMATIFVFNQYTKGSPDPLLRKQALAIASSLLEEIELRGFTYCDPDDAAVTTATAPGDCATQEGIGTEGAETRYGPTYFDNVSDYNGFSMTGAAMKDITDTAIPGLASFQADVAVATTADLPDVTAVDATGALKITVTVSNPSSGISVSLVGYRTRYAPNQP